MLQYLFFTKDRTFWKVVEIATPIISGGYALSIGIIWIVAKLHAEVKGSGYQRYPLLRNYLI
jgi:hypothetical protein